MVSKNQIKLITSLQQKKFRKEHQLFIAEGKKVIQELIDENYELKFLFSTKNDVFLNLPILPQVVSDDVIKKMSALTTTTDCLAVFKIKKQETKIPQKELILVADSINDPGNFGTIIRLCDWFGIEHLVCSEDCVDVYNPKVIQATMGSFARVNITYLNIAVFLKETQLPIFGTFMGGESIYTIEKPKDAIIIMGNEANGISKEIEKLCQRKIGIPKFGKLQKTESLNVATATAIVISEFKKSF